MPRARPYSGCAEPAAARLAKRLLSQRFRQRVGYEIVVDAPAVITQFGDYVLYRFRHGLRRRDQ